MSVEEFDKPFPSFLRLINKYFLDFNVGSVAIAWGTLIIVSIISTIILRAQKAAQLSRDIQRRNARVSEALALESRERDRRDRIMRDYRRIARELHRSAERCYEKEYMIKCIDIVSKYPPLVNVRCPISGLTPFHRVCSLRNSCLVSFMLGHGADCSIKTTTGENALCLLIHSHLQAPNATDFSSLRILVGAGCFFNREDKWYSLFLESALLTGNKALALWILQQSPSPVKKLKSFP